MSSCRRYLKCPFNVLLAFYICKIVFKITLTRIKFFTGIDYGWCQFTFTIDELNYFLYIIYSIY